MARRLRWFVGLAAIGLALGRLGRLLAPALDTPDWRLLLATAAAGGVVATWASGRLGRRLRLLVHLLAMTLLVVRITAPETLRWGIVPTSETAPAAFDQIGYGLEVIRFGAPPVLAVAGVAALAAAGLWVMGATWARSVTDGPAWLGVAPPLAFYLYLSVMDRAPSSLPWNLAFVAVGGLALVVTANPVPAAAGHLRLGERPVPRWHMGPAGRLAAGAGVVAVAGASLLAAVVPAGGAVEWRTAGGEGTASAGGGFAASRFVGLRQSIVSLSDEPVFVAALDETPPSGPSRYWRMLTLDRFNGEEWVAGTDTFVEVTPGVVTAPAAESAPVTQTIRIESLSDDRLPSLFAPQELLSNDSIVRSGTRMGGDGNLRMNALTRRGLSYQVRSEVPALQLPLLARSDGELTPIFEEAVERGEVSVAATATDVAAARPDRIADFLILPDTLGPADTVGPVIAALAREVTAGAASPFEEALLLEHFLGGFRYSTDVSTGHSALDLAAWLTDPESPNYRTGYCEQFAAAMAVMGRMLGLPTRVVIGFTPGETVETEDGPVQVVRERNAHAWVEVWFDGQGWVGFDPTPRSDGTVSPMTRALGLGPQALAAAPGGAATPDFEFPREEFIDDFTEVPLGPVPGGNGLPTVFRFWWVAPVLAAAASVPVLKAVRRRRRLRLASQGDVTAAWAEIVDRLTDLGAGPPVHQTPLEFAQASSSDLLPLARAYSAAVYGGWRGPEAVGHLTAAEQWIDRSYDRHRRTRARFSIRSLLR